ncbi:MAG: orotidine-5'-phosphate decarboxylase [Actinomycetota bacterium]
MKALTTTFKNPLCVALDVAERRELDRLVDQLAGQIGLAKVGLTTFSAFGPSVIGEIAREVPVFVDLKLHDIPMQVGRAARALVDAGAALLTVHAAGGSDMVAAAVKGAGSVPVVGVTILTSLPESQLRSIGFTGTAIDNVARLARLATGAGAAGVVCSPLEIAAVRNAVGEDPLIVTPGIRAGNAESHDQARTMDARSALQSGADVVVVGRPITQAADPAGAAAQLLQEIG